MAPLNHEADEESTQIDTGFKKSRSNFNSMLVDEAIDVANSPNDEDEEEAKVRNTEIFISCRAVN